MDDTPSAYAADDVSEEVLVAEDSRVACLAFVASFFGRPFSARAVLDGLPIDPGVGLTPDQLLRALARLGLEAKLFRRAPSSVPAVFLPCIVLLKNGDGAVVVDRSRNGRRLAVVLPSVSSKKRWMSSKDLDRDSSGFLFYVGHGDADDPDTTPNKHIKSRNSHWFWGPMLRLWPAWLQIAIAAFAINLLGLATPIFIMNVYDRVIPNLAIPTLWALAVGVGLALVFELTLRQLRTVVLDQASQRIDLKVSSYLFEHALGVSMVERQESTGALASRLRDFDGVKDFFASASLIALIDLIFIFIFVWLLWFIVGELALVTLAAVPIVIIVTLLLQIPLARAVAHAQRHGSQRQGILIEGLGAIETVKTVGAESVLQRRWEEAVVANARHSSRVRFWSALAAHFTTGVQQTVSILVIVWGVFLVADGKITIGGLIAANILGARALAPLGNIAMTIARAQQAIQAMDGLSQFVRMPVDRNILVQDGRKIEQGSVVFDKVDFTYPNATREAIKDISFSAAAGERIGIVGRVGSGKSTIGRLMTGLYQPQHGSILLGGAEIRSYEVAEVRGAVNLVLQEPELFSGTLRDNIAIGRPAASEAEISHAVRIAGVDRFAASNPLGLQMPIGEGGRHLSGGQRQAVSLARAVIRQPKIVFLDEPSSAMDTTTENELIAQIDAWVGTELTLFVCSHRMSFLSLVQRLIVIENGHIVADGHRDEVLASLQANNGQTSG